jgi:putative membrane protein
LERDYSKILTQNHNYALIFDVLKVIIMSIHKRFSAADLERIKAAVREGESKISGEIVPVFVERSGYYSIANFRGAILGATISFIAAIFLDRYAPDLAAYDRDPLFLFMAVVIGGLIGAGLINYVEPLKKLILNQAHLDQATRKRAESAFLAEEVFNTRHRTGIMIFVSFFEREVIVMADRGISKVVEQKEWDNLVRGITSHMKQAKVVEGIEAAIKRCGEILLEKGFVQTPDDINELRDDLRVEEN